MKQTLPFAFWLCAGCAEHVTPIAGTVRDSASVRIVEYAEGDTAVAEVWRLRSQPSITIGVAEGEEPYQLFEVSDGMRGSDGRLYVLNSSTAELRVFGPDGVFQRSFGRKGSGPGEFRYPTVAWLLGGDSVMVWDAPLGPWVVFSPEGSVARVRTVDRSALMTLLGPGAATEDVRPFRDGRLVAAAWDSRAENEIPTGEMYRPQFRMVLTDPDLAKALPLGTYGGLEQMYVNIDGRRRSAVAYFSPHYHLALGGARTVTLGNGDRFELRTFDEAGRLDRIIRRMFPPRRVSRQEQDAARAQIIELNDPARRPILERMYAAIPDQDYFPAHAELWRDALENLWVAAYQWPPTISARWTVYDPDGHLLAEVEAPRPGRLLEIGADYVLAVERNADDVEQVVLYDLVKLVRTR
jgi:hypothetical protein